MAVAKSLMTSASAEWYTPADLLGEIRAFLGGDFYDPCPPRGVTDEGERVNGLAMQWQSPTFVNPPYGRAIGQWVRKALTEPIDECVLLVPARTDTVWFAPLFAYPICFLRGRLRFSGAETSAPFPSALVYRGARRGAFMAAFEQRGPVVLAAAGVAGGMREEGRTLWSA